MKKPILFKSINRLFKYKFSSTQNRFIKRNIKEILIRNNLRR